jgi:hypothetical protein
MGITGMLLFMSSNYEVWRIHQVLWGNLGTEEGVNALLEPYPQVVGGRALVYNKGTWGYNDEDSVFMGGYQHWQIIKYDSKPTESSSVVVESQYAPTPPAIEAESLLQDMQPTSDQIQDNYNNRTPSNLLR